ncbi:MAG: hypothetical protein ACMXYD_05385 [Candidatus Woesearchaeota archaeon]
MILTIDTDKESASSLRRIARFLEELTGEEPVSAASEEMNFSEEAFSMFSSEQPAEKKTSSHKDDDDSGFRMIPY